MVNTLLCIATVILNKNMRKFLTRLSALTLALLLGACSAVPQSKELILVGGATGRQGTAVVDELLARGYSVRALTRKPAGKKAQALVAKGVEVVQGDYGDAASLQAAMRGVHKVFFYSGFSRNEVAEGTNVIAAARDAGVTHLVYSSGAAAEPGKGLAGAKKLQVELAIVASGVPYTVLRPVAFVENYAGQQKRIEKMGITDSRDPDRMLHFISIPDIGLFAGEAFDDPDTWLNVATNIAGERMTVQEHVDVFSRVMGQPVIYNQLPLDDFLASLPKPLRPLFRWYDEVGYSADVVALRLRYPSLITLEEYLRATGWEAGE
jgi:uncharacterized protein YbjT (DUF2867 family)